MGLLYGDRLMLIDGKLCDSESGEWIESLSPANEEVIGRVPAGSAEDVNRAVSAAKAAQLDWKKKSVFERGVLLRQLAAEFRSRADEILEMEARDTGNTIAKLGGDVQIAAGYLEFFAGLASEMKGESVPATPDNFHFTVREPYGVVGRIVPFNHPFMFAGAHIAAPLVAGNTVVLKTPEQSPLTGSLLSEMCQKILPAGVVNIVSGYGLPVGDTLVRHADVHRIGFTGSVPTGLAIQKSAAETAVKHITLELGGKNPMIVFPDADLDKVVDAAIAGMNYSWAGQSCGSVSRLMLHESIYDDVVTRMKDRVDAVKLGDPVDPAAEMGPVNNKAHFERVLDFIESAKQDGARLVSGGERPDGDMFEKGYWVRPTLFADVTMDMRIGREEVFGPIQSIIKWRDQDEAIAIANDSEFGLTAAVWTNDLNAAMTTAKALETGYVWINGVAQHYVGTPFGGWKNSGLGGEECLEELLSYTQNKSIHVML